MSFSFTTDWTSANRVDWLRVCEPLKPKSYLEVGSFEGRSVCELLLNASDTIEHVVCIDPWANYSQLPDIDMEAAEKRFDENLKEAVRLCESAGRNVTVHKYKRTSAVTLAGLVWDAAKEDSFDLVYIDGSHMPEDVMLDMMLAIRLVRPGGVMIVDDYLWTVDEHGNDLLDTPRMAVDFFALVMRRYVTDVPRTSLYQRFFQKTRRVP